MPTRRLKAYISQRNFQKRNRKPKKCHCVHAFSLVICRCFPCGCHCISSPQTGCFARHPIFTEENTRIFLVDCTGLSHLFCTCNFCNSELYLNFTDSKLDSRMALDRTQSADPLSKVRLALLQGAVTQVMHPWSSNISLSWRAETWDIP